MNLVFLSLSGVVTPESVNLDQLEDTSVFDREALLLLDEICQDGDAQVVMCGPERREQRSPPQWTSLFRRHGAHHIRVLGSTPVINDDLRGFEVVRFLEASSHPCKNYVILDSTSEYFVWQPCIKVDHRVKLTRRAAYEAIRQLNPESAVLCDWHKTFGYGDLLALVDRPGVVSNLI